MENAILDALIKLGSTGIVAGILWVIAKRFMDETVKQMSSRIESLERRSDECEKDRARLHDKFYEAIHKWSETHTANPRT